LLRNKAVCFSNQVWSIDITYIKMHRGHMYLTAIIDWFSRKIMGWQLSDTLETAPVLDAVRSVVGRFGIPAILNSDQGSQFTSTDRREWYYGVKLHAFVAQRPGQLPAPIALFLSGAAVHDLTAAKQIRRDNHILSAGKLYADKAYIDSEWADILRDESAIFVLTPRKKRKSDTIRSGDAFSTFVGSVRQPIECFSTGLTNL